MKLIVIFLFILNFSANCHAQNDLFVLHSLVGDTIDKTEKINYFLFPSIKNDDFKYCYIIRSNGQFFLNSHTLSDSVSIGQIDTTEIKQYIVNLDKFLAFYLNKAKKDSLKQAKKIDLNYNPVNPMYNNVQPVGEQSRDRIIKEVDVVNRMQTDLERANRTQEGLDLTGGGAYFQFKVKNKKKN